MKSRYSSAVLAIFIILCFSSNSVFNQVRWDGDAGDSLWSNPLNWEHNVLPSASDRVVFDNSFISGNYLIRIDVKQTVSIQSITIQPLAGNKLTVELPVTNTISPALHLTGNNYGLIIEEGGILINASGAGSGAAIILNDSLCIRNGGHYIHRTQRPHAALVDMLSISPGTEKGVFEFDVRSASSTISISGRKYGKLLLSSVSAGGFVNYTASGTMPVIIRSDLQVNPGVRLNLNCSDTLSIHESLLQYGGTINLSSLARTLVVKLNGNLLQLPGSVITETGTAFPSILFAGKSQQLIQASGTIENSVTVSINNTAGVKLMSPLVLPYMLNLIKGIILSSNSSILHLLDGCSLEADSTSNNAYVDGPMKKDGLQNAKGFLFPVGKDQIRWISLKEASGSFTVRFHKENPRLISSLLDDISRISATDYWSITADGTNMSATVELSFYDGNSSGVTDMGTLRVARLEGGTWFNAGSSSTSGSAGGQGSVVSNPISAFTPFEEMLFALASSAPSQNPLPLTFTGMKPVIMNNLLKLWWQISNTNDQDYFVIEQSVNNKWVPIQTGIRMYADKHHYSAEILNDNEKRLIRIAAVSVVRDTVYSEHIMLPGTDVGSLIHIESIFSRIGNNVLDVNLLSDMGTPILLAVTDGTGRVVYTQNVKLQKGVNNLNILLPLLSKGLYQLHILKDRNKMYTKRFFKK